MSRLFHLVATDVQRFRWVLVAWIALELIATIMAGVQPALVTDRRVFSLVGSLTNLLWLIELLLFVVLVPLIVQADSLVTTDAFWMTRPIAPRMLLGAKALLLWIAVVFVPIAMECAVMIAVHHVPATAAAPAVLQNALVQTAALSLLMTVASVTATFSMFALVWVGGLFALAVLVGAGGLVETAFGSRVWSWVGKGTADSTDSVVFMLLWIGACSSALLVQYRRRAWGRSATIAAVGTIAALVISTQWPWPLIRSAQDVPDWALQSTALQLAGDAAAVKVERSASIRGTLASWNVTAGLRMLTLPDAWSAQVQLEAAQVTLADGRSFSCGPASFSAIAVAGEDRVSGYSAIRKLLDVKAIPQGQMSPEGPVMLSLSDQGYRELNRTPGRYEGRFRVTLTHNDVHAVLSLKPGALFQDGAFRIVVEGVRLHDQVPLVLVRESDATSIFEREPRGTHVYYLRNRSRSEALPASGSRWMQSEPPIPRVMPFALYAGTDWGFTAFARELSFDHNPRTGVAPVDPGWLAGAELVVARSTYRGAVDRTLVMERFAVPGNVVSRSGQ